MAISCIFTLISMEILGAIYIHDGKLVSLYKGDFNQVSTYHETPVHFAKYLQKEGLNEVHFVDLNASLKHALINHDLLKEIVTLGLKVQYGGGVRDMAMIEELFALGVNQVVLGLSAFNILAEAINKYGKEKILLGVKTKYDQLVSDQENRNVLDYAETMIANSPVEYLVFHDILSSGVMIHPNYDMVEKIGLLSGKKVYTAGGISETKHLTILKNNDVYAAIIGKAFYERKLSVKAALRVAQG